MGFKCEEEEDEKEEEKREIIPRVHVPSIHGWLTMSQMSMYLNAADRDANGKVILSPSHSSLLVWGYRVGIPLRLLHVGTYHMFTCQVHELYTRAEEEEEEEEVKIKKNPTLYCLLCNTPHTIMNIPYDRVHVPRVRRPDQTAVCRVYRHFNITTNIMVWFCGTFVSPGGIISYSINQCTIIVHCMLESLA